jgi:phosphatidylglycerophosphatase A
LCLPLWFWTGGFGLRHYLLLAALLAVAVPAAREEMAATGRKDPPTVVIDEIVGMLLATSGIAWGWRHAVVLFLLFRAFDIFKFGPAAWVDAREGPVYVMADDLVAGVYAALAYRGIAWLTA